MVTRRKSDLEQPSLEVPLLIAPQKDTVYHRLLLCCIFPKMILILAERRQLQVDSTMALWCSNPEKSYTSLLVLYFFFFLFSKTYYCYKPIWQNVIHISTTVVKHCSRELGQSKLILDEGIQTWIFYNPGNCRANSSQ